MAHPTESEHDGRQVSVTPCKDGPLLVRGEIELVTQGGQQIDTGRKTIATQYTVGVGPCLQALEDGSVVEGPDLTNETRWGPLPGHSRRLLVVDVVSMQGLVRGSVEDGAVDGEPGAVTGALPGFLGVVEGHQTATVGAFGRDRGDLPVVVAVHGAEPSAETEDAA